MMDLTEKLKKVKALGKMDAEDFQDVVEMGMLVDLNNQMVDREKEKAYLKKVDDLNDYYWKLWKSAAIEAGLEGVRRPSIDGTQRGTEASIEQIRRSAQGKKIIVPGSSTPPSSGIILPS